MTTMLGVTIGRKTKAEIAQELERFLLSDRSHQIVTANPEMLIATRRDQELKSAMNNASMVVADGVGIDYVSRILGKGKVPRITGTDIVMNLFELAENKKLKVFFVGGFGDQARRAARAIEEQFEGIRTASNNGGHMWKEKNGNWHMNRSILNHIRRFEPDIVLVALGHGKQEKWIADFKDEFPSVKVMVGVGGVFSFLSGDIRRAPLWMQEAGIEWLYRFMKEPQRLIRIFKAVIIFPIRAFFDRVGRKAPAYE